MCQVVLTYILLFLPAGPDDCTFENGLCGFTNVDGDDFDWTIRMGKTPSGRTGPEADHTTLRFGEFIRGGGRGRGFERFEGFRIDCYSLPVYFGLLQI